MENCGNCVTESKGLQVQDPAEKYEWRAETRQVHIMC